MHIKNYILVDKFDSIKNIKTSEKLETDKIRLFFLNNNKTDKNIYYKKDLIEKYFFIDIIYQNNKYIRILFPKDKYNSSNDENIILNDLWKYSQIILEVYIINMRLHIRK